MDDIAARKAQVRAGVSERRGRRTPAEREQAARALAERMAALVEETGAHTVTCYLSSATEPGTQPFLDWAAEHDVAVLLPVCRSDGLLDWTYGGEGVRTVYGIPEAVGPLLGVEALRDADLAFAPASAIDRTGLRLGWGRGHFDKTLAAVGEYPTVFAVIHDDELVETVPREPHDRSVNGVVTPGGVVRFADAAP